MKNLSRNEALTLSSPHPYVIATMLDPKGKPNGIGLGWWTFVSWEPLIVAISVGNSRYSYQCLKACREFVLNFPTEKMAEQAWVFGTKSGRKVDKFALTKLATIPANTVKPPVIEGVTCAFECQVINEVEAGDHTVFFGKVTSMHGDPKNKLHLYSIHYEKLVALDCEGRFLFNPKQE